MKEINELIVKTAFALLANRPKPILHFIERHFGKRPRTFPIVQATFPIFRQGCIERAMQHYLRSSGVRCKIIGVASTDSDLTLRDLINIDKAAEETEGPFQYVDIELNDGSNLSCNVRALYLIREPGKRFVVFVNQSTSNEIVTVEVLAPKREIAEEFLKNIRAGMDRHSIYKGNVLAMRDQHGEEWALRFHKVPTIRREDVVLPADVLEEIERHTMTFATHASVLRSRGQHLKRGILLWGPPGTGKSLSVMYLISSMPGRTTILINSTSSYHLVHACDLARALQPSTVIIDDVDLIATKRSYRDSQPVLVELLNQMDGVADDADVLFVLTTNQPEALEDALANRPGRVDQAIMVPLPDEECRTRLFELYGGELPMVLADRASFIRRTEGVNAAFIRELFRKASLLAAEQGHDEQITDLHLERALKLLQTNPLTAKVLGCEAQTT
jgi:ATP-dependent 26S proteasome regulatory subunit